MQGGRPLGCRPWTITRKCPGVFGYQQLYSKVNRLGYLGWQIARLLQGNVMSKIRLLSPAGLERNRSVATVSLQIGQFCDVFGRSAASRHSPLRAHCRLPSTQSGLHQSILVSSTPSTTIFIFPADLIGGLDTTKVE